MKKAKKEDKLLKNFMDENPEAFLEPIDILPDFETFLKSVEPEKRIIREQIAHKKERKIIWVRRLSVATGIVVVLLLTFTFVPEARAGIKALGTQIVKLFSSGSQDDIEFIIREPEIMLIERKVYADSITTEATYDYNGIEIHLLCEKNGLARLVVSNQKGDIKQAEILGSEMEYYYDEDGYIGSFIYNNYSIVLKIKADSEEMFLRVANCLQIVHNS